MKVVIFRVSCLANFLPWRWRWYVPPKRSFTYVLQGAISQKMATFFALIAVFLSVKWKLLYMRPFQNFLESIGILCASKSSQILNIYSFYSLRLLIYVISPFCAGDRHDSILSGATQCSPIHLMNTSLTVSGPFSKNLMITEVLKNSLPFVECEDLSLHSEDTDAHLRQLNRGLAVATYVSKVK
jgi:hypothetical protein